MKKELTDLVSRLERIFPDLDFFNEGHYFDDDVKYLSFDEDEDYCPPIHYNWFDIIKKLNEGGLTIQRRIEKNKNITNEVEKLQPKLKKIFPYLVEIDPIYFTREFNWSPIIKGLDENGLEINLNN